jgi:hypothetical protein
MKPAAENNLPIDAVLPFTEQRHSACFMYPSCLVSTGIPALYRSPVLAQYRFLYCSSTDSCTGAVPIND